MKMFWLGKVVTAPANVNTNPESRDLFKFRKHLPDQYDRARELRNVNFIKNLRLLK